MARRDEGKRASGGGRKAGGRKAGARASAASGGPRKTAAKRPAARKTAGRRPPARKTAGARPAARKTAAGRRPSAQSKARAAKRTGTGRGASARRGRLWIESPDQRAERPGQTLATRNHEVIRAWAEQRGAVPATVPGTEHDGRPGVLRFDFPNFGGGRLRQVDWDEWFETFDARNLVFLFQEQLKDGRQSNFFRLDNPEREDA